MSVTCTCKSCGKKYQVGPHRYGTVIECRECGFDIQVSSPRSSTAGMQSSNAINLRMVAIPAGIVIALLLVTVAYLLGKSNSAQHVAVVPAAQTVSSSARWNEVNPGTSAVGEQRSGFSPPGENSANRNSFATPASSFVASSNPSATASSTQASVTPPSASSPSNVQSTTIVLPATGAKAEWSNGDAGSSSSSTAKTKQDSKPSTEWGGEGSVIPFSDRNGLTVGPPGCPILVSGQQVWDKQRKTVIAGLESSYEGRGQTTLSPDGHYFAAASKSPNQQDTDVTVWDTGTGKKLFVAKGDPERFADTILLSNTKLFLGGRLSADLLVWDCATGEQVKTLSFKETKFDKGKSTMSSDGGYIATVVNDRLVVLNCDTGRQAAVMAARGAMPRDDGTALVIKDNKVVADSRSMGNDSVFVYAWLQSLEFSTDMQELAGVSTHPRPRVLCWNQRGKLVFDQPIYSDRRAFWDNTLQWFPDRSAWLIENEIFDRASGRIVLSVEQQFGSDTHLYVYDDKSLLGRFAQAPDSLEVMEIPWTEIRKSLSLINDESSAYVRPGGSVRVELNLGAVRGDAQSTSQMLQTAIQQRLARDQISISPLADATFRLKFAESAGEQLPIYERQSPFDWRGTNTGRTATEAAGSLIVELFVPGNDQPIWRESIRGMSSRSFHDEQITDQTMRASMLSGIQHQVNDLNFPYFIPISKDVLALPVVVQ